MDYETKEMLNAKIKELTRDIESLPAGSEERARAVKDLETLGKLYVEIKKAESEASKSNDELLESKKDRWVKIAIAGVEIAVVILFDSFWMAKGFKFEETGSLTSGTFKEFRNNNKIIKFFKK